MLDDVRVSFEIKANLLPNWRTCSKLSLAKGYVEHENDELRESYFGAFCLRYWYQIPVLYKASEYIVRNAHLTQDDIGDWFFEAIMKVLKMRSFMDITKMKYVDEENEDKFINRCVYTAIENTRKNYFQYYNFKKRGGELYTESLDTYMENNEDDCVQEESTYTKVDLLIKNLVGEKRIFEALVIYMIVYGDVFVPRQEIVNEKTEEEVPTTIFSEQLLYNRIYNLEDRVAKAFVDEYGNGTLCVEDVKKFQYYSLVWKKVLFKKALTNLQSRGDLREICY